MRTSYTLPKSSVSESCCTELVCLSSWSHSTTATWASVYKLLSLYWTIYHLGSVYPVSAWFDQASQTESGPYTRPHQYLLLCANITALYRYDVELLVSSRSFLSFLPLWKLAFNERFCAPRPINARPLESELHLFWYSRKLHLSVILVHVSLCLWRLDSKSFSYQFAIKINL